MRTNTFLLHSRSLANTIQSKLQHLIANQKAQGLRPPGLAMILVGKDPASTIYVRHKQRICEKIGMYSTVFHQPDTFSQHALLEMITRLNQTTTVDGILVQLPLPRTIEVSYILDAIDPMKDVDGFHPNNIGRLTQARPIFRACTPYGIMQLLHTLPIRLSGLHAVIVGASNIVGKPMALELLQAGCTVSICHSQTKNLAFHVQQADLLISAVGKAKLIQSNWIKFNAIVIDAGINRDAEGLITGDIDFLTAKERAYAITPVPGGVGPMTVTALMQNTWTAYQMQI